jgi:hypothetical protein
MSKEKQTPFDSTQSVEQVVDECFVEKPPPADKLDEVQNELRDGLLHVVRTTLLGVAGSLTAQNAARGLQLVEQVCTCERDMLAYLSGGVITRSANPKHVQYLEGIGAALGVSEPDGETFGAQSIKAIIDTVTQALGVMNSGPKPSRDQARRKEIEVAEAGLRAAKLLGDSDLVASRSSVLRKLLKDEDFVDGAGEFEPASKAGWVDTPDELRHVTEDAWYKQQAKEHAHEEDQHPCDNWQAEKCMCDGACSCHWVQPELPGGLKPPHIEIDVGTRVIITGTRLVVDGTPVYEKIDPVGYMGYVAPKYGVNFSVGLTPASDDPRWLEGTIVRLHHPCKPSIDRLSTLDAGIHGITGFGIIEDEPQEPRERDHRRRAARTTGKGSEK